MQSSEPASAVLTESRSIASRRNRSWAWLVAIGLITIGLIVLGGAVILNVNRIMVHRVGDLNRAMAHQLDQVQYQLIKIQHQLGPVEVSALGSTFYVQPEDDVITRELLTSGYWELDETLEARAILRPGDTFIDVGADFGWYTVIGAKAVGPTGRVIAFEPVPRNLEFLRRNVAANGCANAKLEPIALSNKSGKITMHLNRTNLGNHSMLEAQDRPDSIDVQAMTLDEYLKDYSGKIALIKIDTEGAEGYILEGMRETLRKHPETVIFMEFTPRWLQQSGYDPEAMLRKMSDQGYEIQYFLDDHSKQRTAPVPESQISEFVKNTGAKNLLMRQRVQR